MKEYDPESGTYQNAEVDSQTKEIRYGECSPNEDEIVYEHPKKPKNKFYHRWWFWCIFALLLITPWVVLFFIHHTPEASKEEIKDVVTEAMDSVMEQGNPDLNAGSLTVMDSSNFGNAYTEIIDTVFKDVHLSIYKVHYGIPELYVCDSVDIDMGDSNIVFAARAADYGKDTSGQIIIGLFVYKGKLLANGCRKKEGFCSIIHNNITIGAGKTTPLLEEAIETEGYFFRHLPLVVNGIVLPSATNDKQLRRALCNLNNDIVYIECRDKMTLNDFAELLSDFGVQTAINMVGAQTGYGFCRDKDGRLHQWGKNTHTNFQNISYLIWKNK